MRGGQVFMESLVAHGVSCIFGNPGTTENSVLDRLIDYPIDYYVTLHEGVAVGAASFFAQATGQTGIVNLHVAPGLGNGIGMIYGALKANSPMIITAGQQDTRLRLRSPILGHDLVAMAAPVTKWSAEPRSADELDTVMQRAFKIANDPPCGPVFVALPGNVLEQDTQNLARVSAPVAPASAADEQALSTAAKILLNADNPVILAGDDIVYDGANTALISLAEAIGAPVYHQGLRARLSFPNRHPHYRGRIAFEAANIAKRLSPHDVVLLVGGLFFEELWFDDVNPLPDGIRVIQLERTPTYLAMNFPVDVALSGHLKQSIDALLHTIADGDNSAGQLRRQVLIEEHVDIVEGAATRLRKVWDDAPMAPARAVHEIAQAAPSDAVIVEEAITASLEVGTRFDFQDPSDYYAGRGGGIGQGLAGAIGTQVANPNRRVIAISGDGSAMYSIQALWSAAHHDLPIVFVIFANREYRVLKHNLDVYRQRFDVASNKPYPHMDLRGPALDMVRMAEGMGVSGERVVNADEIAAAMGRALAESRPYLIEIDVAGKPE